MKKYLAAMLLLTIPMLLPGCFRTVTRVDFVIPAGTESQVIYSDMEVSPKTDYIEIASGENLGDTSVSLKQVGDETQNEGEYLTTGVRVRLSAEQGTWYRIGIIGHNPGDQDITVSVMVTNAEVRVP